VWDFLDYKVRIGRTCVILSKKDETLVVRIMPVSCKSRYFSDGRMHISRKIKRRLRKYGKVPGLMVTITYDTKRIGKREAWKESEWQRWQIIETEHPEQLEKGLEEGGYTVEHNERKEVEHDTERGK